jgi:hypothetical protein
MGIEEHVGSSANPKYDLENKLHPRGRARISDQGMRSSKNQTGNAKSNIFQTKRFLVHFEEPSY